MRVALATEYYDNQGFVEFNAHPASILETYNRRITRTATLDGLSTIADMGYTASDATFTVKIQNASSAIADGLSYLLQTYPLLYLSTTGGVYWGALNNLDVSKNPVQFQFLVKSKII